MTLKKYHHLTQDQRYQLEELGSRGLTTRMIADKIGVSASTVSREKARNSDKNGKYNYLFAERESKKRRKEAGTQRHKIKGELEQKVKEKLLQTWSPEQTAGWLKNEDNVHISVSTIYKYAKSGKVPVSCLRHGGKKYKQRKKTAGVKFIPNRVDISERPAIVEQESRVGDWEGDLVISHGSHCALLTLVDRASKRVITEKIEDKTVKSTSAAIIKALKNQPVYTITFDNGSEFAGHETVSKTLKTKIYFARPYKSCERGLNEHTNGLIRQFLPKKFDFKNLTNHEIKIKEKSTETSQQSFQKTQTMEKARKIERARLIKTIEQRRREIDRLEEEYIYPIKTEAFCNSYGRSPQLESWRPEKRTAKAKIPVLESEIQALEIQLSNL